MKFSLVIAAAAASVALVATSASAAVVFDSSTGTGFVGKGDVQTALGWNNKQLQDGAAGLAFAYSSTSTTATTWTCDRDGGDQTQERANTTTTTTQGVVNSVARERNQITGFIMSGFDGSASQTTQSDGPAVGSCPTFWTAVDLVEGDPVHTGGGLTVNGVSLS